MSTLSKGGLLDRIPLIIALIAPFVMLTVITVGLVGYLSFRNGRQAVNDVARKLGGEITLRIEDHLKTFLEKPYQINEINSKALHWGWLDINNTDRLEQYFWEQVRIFKSVTSIYFGGTAGGIVNSGREGAAGIQYVIITEGLKSGVLRKYATDDQGNYTKLLASVPGFDVRKRLWYTGAVTKGAGVWSPVYILSTGQDMAIAASRPVYDRQRKLLGVVSVDIFLSHISHFLKNLSIGKTGKAFIIERSGLMIASSINGQYFTDHNGIEPQRRYYAWEVSNRIIRRAAEEMKLHWPDFQDIRGDAQFQFQMEGRSRFLHVSPVEDQNGLKWLIVVVIPEEDFMAQIMANNRTTRYLIVMAVMVVLLIGFLAARKITGPVNRLRKSARSLARGDKIEAIPDDSRLGELSDLTRAFNRMSGQLQQMLLDLNREIEDRKQVEEALLRNEAVLNDTQKMTKVGGWEWDVEKQTMYWTDQVYRIHGLQVDHIKTKDKSYINQSLECFDPDHRQVLMSAFDDCIAESRPYDLEFPFTKADGTRIWIRTSAKPITENGRVIKILGNIMDITDKKIAEERMRVSLQEKEVLLKEIHHRVKNNMQVINSLLNLQMAALQNKEACDAIRESQGRIYSMALVHEMLYQNENLSTINLEEYLLNLTNALIGSYSISTAKIRVNFDLEPIVVGINKAPTLGLILNELITNSLKYAFPANETGTINIKAGSFGQRIEIVLSDDGIGFPEGFEWRSSETLGLKIVRMLTEDQLMGSLELKGGPGTEFIIRFPG